MPSILIKLEMPDAAAVPQEPACPPLSVEDQVRDALSLIDSGHDSPVEWGMITRLYSSLRAKKSVTPRIQNILDLIEPVLGKYGYHEKMPNT